MAEAAKAAVQQAEAQLERATTADDRWLAQYSIWKERTKEAWNMEDLKAAEEDFAVFCPRGVCQKEEDLPLWELELLRQQYKWREEVVDEHSEPQRQILLGQLSREVRQLAVYKKAYEGSKAEAERLCSGRTFQSATGLKTIGPDTLTSIEELSKTIAQMEQDLENTRVWAARVPAAIATMTSERIEQDIQYLEIMIAYTREKKQGLENID